MLSPLDFEGAIEQKQLEAEQHLAFRNQLSELEDEPGVPGSSIRVYIGKLLLGIALKLDPEAVSSL